MLHPSYNEMIAKMNETAAEGDQKISSRFSLVIAASRRARQINAGSEPLVRSGEKEKNLSIAVQEIYAGQVHILEETEEELEAAEYEVEEIETEITAEEA